MVVQGLAVGFSLKVKKEPCIVATRRKVMSKGADIKKETKKKPTKTLKEKKAEKKVKKENKG